MEEGPLVFFVNGKRVEDAKVDPEETLLYYLRNTLKLCGTKVSKKFSKFLQISQN